MMCDKAKVNTTGAREKRACLLLHEAHLVTVVSDYNCGKPQF